MTTGLLVEARIGSVLRIMRDNPDESYPANWICWQKPTCIASDGKYLAGINGVDKQGRLQESR